MIIIIRHCMQVDYIAMSSVQSGSDLEVLIDAMESLGVPRERYLE